MANTAIAANFLTESLQKQLGVDSLEFSHDRIYQQTEPDLSKPIIVNGRPSDKSDNFYHVMAKWKINGKTFAGLIPVETRSINYKVIVIPLLWTDKIERHIQDDKAMLEHLKAMVEESK